MMRSSLVATWPSQGLPFTKVPIGESSGAEVVDWTIIGPRVDVSEILVVDEAFSEAAGAAAAGAAVVGEDKNC